MSNLRLNFAKEGLYLNLEPQLWKIFIFYVQSQTTNETHGKHCTFDVYLNSQFLVFLYSCLVYFTILFRCQEFFAGYEISKIPSTWIFRFGISHSYTALFWGKSIKSDNISADCEKKHFSMQLTCFFSVTRWRGEKEGGWTIMQFSSQKFLVARLTRMRNLHRAIIISQQLHGWNSELLIYFVVI